MFTAEALFRYCLEFLDESEQASQKVVRGQDVEQARERHAEHREADRSGWGPITDIQSVESGTWGGSAFGRQSEA